MTLTFLCRFLPSAGRPSRWWRYWPAQSNSRSSAGPAVRPRAEQTGPGGLKGTAPEAAPTPESRPTWKLGVEVFVITLVYIMYNSWEAGRGPGGGPGFEVFEFCILFRLFIFLFPPSHACHPSGFHVSTVGNIFSIIYTYMIAWEGLFAFATFSDEELKGSSHFYF